ncbi:heterokaryon incompatibility protein-domain-containing protein [Cadophora sp. MPI-SDFR-AT-0126]|nr:heterokaryon incompatibility protein-domain-containing protein [Leotiomycetes sp. MPI-SDFR-AT-0126]
MDAFKGSQIHRRLRGSDIRVVRFKPCSPASRGDDRIEGKLFHVPLGSSDFFALSYVWGDANDTRLITLNEKEFPITVNLWSAIMGFRNRYDPHRKPYDKEVPRIQTDEIDGDNISWKKHAICWWIDAICINQSNMKERSRQIPRMKELYSTATRVVIWWGGIPTDEDSDQHVMQVVAAAEALHDGILTLPDSSGFLDAPAETKISILNQEVVETQDIAQLLISILVNGGAWMMRTWTLQEAVLAREYPVLLVGKEATSLWKLAHLKSAIAAALKAGQFGDYFTPLAGVLLAPLRLDNILALAFKLSSRARGTTRSSPRSANPLRSRLDLVAQFFRIRISSSRTENSATLSQFGSELLERLASFSEGQTTVPHDRIYGLLGLTDFPELPRYIQPDYSRSFGDVFHEYTKFLLKTTKSIDVLALGTPGRLQGFPTWVPDYTECLNYQPTDIPFAGEFSENDRCLSVPSFCLGKVTAVHSSDPAVSRGYMQAAEGPSKVLDIFLDLARTIMIPASHFYSRGTQRILQDWARFVSCIFGGFADDILSLHQAIERGPPSSWGLEALSCVGVLNLVFLNFTHILLANGSILVSLVGSDREGNNAAAGDFAYKLRGATSPILLRPRTQAVGFEVLGFYELVVSSHSLDAEVQQGEIVRLY